MSDTTLRFGVFLAPFHALNENPTLLFERDLELMVLLDRLGYDEAWIGEHHSGGFETIAAPEIFIAAAARETRRIRLGTGVKSLPYTHPFMLADAMVQLDHMTRGARHVRRWGPAHCLRTQRRWGSTHARHGA